MSWQALSSLPPLRDEHGPIVLEEADDDARTAVFRVHGRRSVTATVAPGGEIAWAGGPPPALLAALAPQAADAAPPASPAPPAASAPPAPASRGRGALVAAGVAGVGLAVLAARRRR